MTCVTLQRRGIIKSPGSEDPGYKFRRFTRTLAKKKSRRKYSAAKEARRRARELAGQPPAQRVLRDKRRKPPKHKKQWIEQELA